MPFNSLTWTATQQPISSGSFPWKRHLNDQIDTTTLQGKFTFLISATMAEFERDIIRERTMAGLVAARARGRKGGRPKGLSKRPSTWLSSLRGCTKKGK
jgi:hypothetical protein